MKLNWLSLAQRSWLAFALSVFVPILASAQTGTNRPVAAEASTTNNVAVMAPVRRLVAEDYITFGFDRIPGLDATLAGIALYHYMAMLVFILLAYLAARLMDTIVRTQLKRWASRTKTRLDDLVVRLLQGPVQIISFVILLHLGLRVFPWPDWLASWISKGLIVVVAASITFVAMRMSDVLVQHWRKRARAREDLMLTEQVFSLASRTLKGFIVVVAVLVTTQNLGLNITAMIASLSIGGLALGLAAQDTVANLFGAVAVYLDKPFQVGDWVRIDSVSGSVESIGLRSTRLRNADGHLITVPNKTMGNATITNVTRRPNIKTEMNIGIPYYTPAEKVTRALEILKEVYGKHPMTEDLIVSFNRFADSALNINVVHWWRSTDARAHLAGMQELNLAVKKRFDSEKIEFAFPTQTLYVKQEPSA
jgi:MscS family membrane protein